MYNIGDIVIVNLEPVEGHEQGETRPCIIISVPTKDKNRNIFFGLFIIVPLTKTDKKWWTSVKIKKSRENNLKSDSYALCQHIRSISINRINKKAGKIGKISKKDLIKIKRVVAEILGI